MDYDDLVRAVLWQGVEVIERFFFAVFEVNTLHLAGKDTGINLAAAIGVLCDLSRRGWIAVYRADSLSFDAQREVVEPQEALRLLADPGNYRIYDEPPFVLFDTTALGQEYVMPTREGSDG